MAKGSLKKNSANSSSKNLERLLERIALEKDQRAFNELYTATKGRLFLTAMQIVKRGHMAEEIIQDSYSRIWLNAGSYRPLLGSPMNWMITIVRNLSIDIVKKSAWEIYSDDTGLMELTSNCPSALEAIEASEERQTVVRQTKDVFSALHGLDPLKRDLVIAAYILGESRAQLSEKAGVPVNTVKTWIRRTLLEVKEILRNTESETEQLSSVSSSRYVTPATDASENSPIPEASQV